MSLRGSFHGRVRPQRCQRAMTAASSAGSKGRMSMVVSLLVRRREIVCGRLTRGSSYSYNGGEWKVEIAPVDPGGNVFLAIDFLCQKKRGARMGILAILRG